MTLLGNSWGGFLISAYAAAHPDRVERLILDVSAPPYYAQLAQMEQEISRRVDARMSKADRRRAERLVIAWQDSDDPLPACQAFYGAILLAYTFDPSQVPPHRGDLCAGRPEAVRRQLL